MKNTSLYNYNEDVTRLRNRDSESFQGRVKVEGERALEFGYKLAIGITAYIVEERIIRDTPVYKIFTGTRVWMVPKNDCTIL